MTPFPNKKAQQSMQAFLRQQLRRLNEITGNTEHGMYMSDPKTSLAYGTHKEKVIGFDYKTVHYDREYCYLLCQWMAINAGKTKSFKGNILPYIIYDGIEDIPIASVKDTHPLREAILVDEVGLHNNIEAQLLSVPSTPIIIPKMREELVRLTSEFKHTF